MPRPAHDREKSCGANEADVRTAHLLKHCIRVPGSNRCLANLRDIRTMGDDFRLTFVPSHPLSGIFYWRGLPTIMRCVVWRHKLRLDMIVGEPMRYRNP